MRATDVVHGGILDHPHSRSGGKDGNAFRQLSRRSRYGEIRTGAHLVLKLANSMTTHTLEVSRAVLHGCFDCSRPPVLEIDSGDSVVLSTMDAGWGWAGRLMGESVPEFQRHPEADNGHALSGPIYVRGATPGAALEVEIREVRPGGWGYTWAGPRPFNARYDMGLERDAVLHWKLDVDAGVAHDRNGLGLTVPLWPFMGVMGNAPAAPGRLPTAPPRRVGGNIDCRELVAGSTLYLPVEVEGALFSLGDGHAAQGDGEVSQTAIECPMERVEVVLRLRDDLVLDAPQAETPAGFITFGFGDTLDDAAPMALDGMLRHLTETTGLERPEAMALASLVVQMRITQVVNGVVGVHAVLPPDAF